ncbi:MAG: sensor histidine kinase, partial [Epsilonproteobacteria bacterium]|nr:sensor histidine kinase [Campylobacterota bacterium]NPA63717.1 sensor histidine kinase [Campylobacterota bacterium]
QTLLTNKIYKDKDEIYALFPIPNSKKYFLKVSYANEKLQADIQDLFIKLFSLYLFATLIIFGLSFFFTLYSLKPIRQALKLNQEFIKDILHDFNTPISSMVINLAMLQKRCDSPYVKRIEQSLQTILSLQENLRHFLKNIKSQKQSIDLNELLKDRIDYFRQLYPHLRFKLYEHTHLVIHSQRELLTRIIDNLLSNACKYNKTDGFVHVYIEPLRIVIEDSGRGIKDSKRVFDRFYKESDRGIGIGLSIVKKLCDELDIDIKIESELNKGTNVTLKFPRK